MPRAALVNPAAGGDSVGSVSSRAGRPVPVPRPPAAAAVAAPSPRHIATAAATASAPPPPATKTAAAATTTTATTAPPRTTTPSLFPWRQVVGLGVARCFARASLTIMVSCNTEMLIRHVFDGDALRAQLLLAKIGTVDTLASFWLGPIKTSLLERYGRKAGMVWPTLLMAGVRAWYTLSPSRLTYVLYRCIMSSCASFFGAYNAALTDLFDPTSDTYTATSQMLDQCATVTGMLTLLLVRYIGSPRRGMLVASAAYVAAAITVQLLCDETLAEGDRVSVPWRRLMTNPLAPLVYFARSPELLRFHTLAALWDVADGGVGGVLGMFRRQVHGWGMQETAQQQFRGQVFEIVGSFGTLPALRSLGVFWTFFAGKVASTLATVVNIVAPSRWMFLTTLLAALRYDMAAESRAGSHWRVRAGASMSEYRAANMNLFRLINLVMPNVWTRLYAATAASRPRTVFAVCLALQMALLGATHHM